MSRRVALLTSCVFCIVTFISLSMSSAGNAPSGDWKTLEKNYAEANLELAEASLVQARHANETVRNTLSQETIDSLEDGVKIAKARLQQLSEGAGANSYRLQIQAAEEELAEREKDYSDSLEANRQQVDAVKDVSLRCEKAELDVARARLEAIRALARQPAEARMQWEIAQLRDEIRALWARPLIED